MARTQLVIVALAIAIAAHAEVPVRTLKELPFFRFLSRAGGSGNDYTYVEGSKLSRVLVRGAGPKIYGGKIYTRYSGAFLTDRSDGRGFLENRIDLTLKEASDELGKYVVVTTYVNGHRKGEEVISPRTGQEASLSKPAPPVALPPIAVESPKALELRLNKKISGGYFFDVWKSPDGRAYAVRGDVGAFAGNPKYLVFDRRIGGASGHEIYEGTNTDFVPSNYSSVEHDYRLELDGEDARLFRDGVLVDLLSLEPIHP